MACPAWVLTSIGANAPELRRVKSHLERGGAVLLRNDVDYVRVMHRGESQPSTTTNGLTLKVKIDPPMNHHSGKQIALTGHVYMPRKLNVSTPHVCMPKYLLVDPQLNWLTVLPPEDVERTQNAIDGTFSSSVDFPTTFDSSSDPTAGNPLNEASNLLVNEAVIAENESRANPIGDRMRNSMLVMGSSFITAAFQVARNHLGLKTTFFLAGAGLLAATEYSDQPVISHGTVWIANSTSEWRSEVWGRAAETWEWTKALFFGGITTLWLMLMCVLWSYLRKTPQQAAVATGNTTVQGIAGMNCLQTDVNALGSTGSTPTLVHGMSPSPNVCTSTDNTGAIPKPVHGVPLVKAEPQSTSLSGATSGVESGAEEIIDVDACRSCMAESVLLDSNPRSPLAFVPCFSDNLTKCMMMLGDGVSSCNKPNESALNDTAELCPAHLRMYADRIKLWRCRAEGCNEKGHHMEMDGMEIVECTAHLKRRLQTVASLPEKEKPMPTLPPKQIASLTGEVPNTADDTTDKAKKPTDISEPADSINKRKPAIKPVSTTAQLDSSPTERRQSLPVHLSGGKAESSIRPTKAFHFDEAVDNVRGRFEEKDDSSEQDLEFLHARQEHRTAPTRAKTPKPRTEKAVKPSSRKDTKDVTKRWQQLCSERNSSKGSRTSSGKSATGSRNSNARRKHADGHRGKRRRHSSSMSGSSSGDDFDSSDSTSSGTSSDSKKGKSRRREKSKRNGSSGLPKFLRQTMAHATDPPMELLQDPEMLKRRKSGSSKVASAILSAVSQNQAQGETKHEVSNTKLQSFAVFAMRGFGKFDHTLGIGVFSDQLEDALIRTSNSRRELMLNSGWRFQLTARLARAAAKLTIGAYSNKDVLDHTAMLNDFYRLPMEVLENCTSVKGKFDPRKASPDTIARFKEAALNQIMFIRDVYGSQHVSEREDALAFLCDLAEEQPELFPPSFLNDCWERMNADYCDAVFEGVRCIMQVLDVTADRRDFWRVASTPRSKEEGGGMLWRYPDTWKMQSEQGYWRRTIIPQLKIAYKRSHLTSAVSRYLSDRHITAVPKADANANSRKGTGTQINEETRRLYPAGPPLSKSERNLAWEHTPVDKDGKKMCWDFSSKMTCSRGAKCNYSHELMKTNGVHWTVYAELLRRGGHRRNRKVVEVKDIEGRIKQLRENNAKEKGEHINSSARTGKKRM